MEDKPKIELRGHDEEMERLRHDNQRLRAEVERVRRERDDAETRFAGSQTKVAELEHQVRKQTWRIADLEAEVRLLPKAPSDSRPPPPVAPVAPLLPEVIEISDHEEYETLHAVEIPKQRSGVTSTPVVPQGIRPQTPSKGRQFMDFVSVPPATSPYKSRAPTEMRAVESKVNEASQPGRFKRARPVSSSLDRSSPSTLVDASPAPRSASPVTVSPAKRQKSPTKFVKKIKKEAFTVPQDVINMYLSNTPDLEIDPAPLDSLYVPRAFLREEFGGSDQQFVQYFSPVDGAEHGRQLVFPQSDLNPFVPSRPGAAGLIFASRREITQNPPWSLFCKDHPSGAAIWRYMGEYENEVRGSWTVDQFRSQKPEVKKRWGELILRSNKWTVYVAMRARIALRKAGLPMDPEAEAREIQKIRDKKGIPLTPQDIINALSAGYEAIDIIQMQCVSYDHEFAADMGRRFAKWNRPTTVGTRKGGAAGKKNQRPTKRKQTQLRKRASPPTSDDSDSDFSMESEKSDSVASVLRVQLRSRQSDREACPSPHSPSGSVWDEEMSDLTDYND
ncbi:hypothetical protein FB451DRAFT_1375863 [Mycena latifolia]|nr:hypothetical protein FB451DRAFT_1375863 [Mycena latifolia]